MLNGFGDADKIEALRAGLESEFGVTVHYNGADMRDPAQVTAMVEDATARLGKVDILINNAGMQHRAPAEDFPPDIWDDMLAVNLSAPFHATRTVLPQMKARDWGRIINTASTNALVASPNIVGYTATKHGLLGMTKAVAIETAETGVTCNAKTMLPKGLQMAALCSLRCTTTKAGSAAIGRTLNAPTTAARSDAAP